MKNNYIKKQIIIPSPCVAVLQRYKNHHHDKHHIQQHDDAQCPTFACILNIVHTPSFHSFHLAASQMRLVTNPPSFLPPEFTHLRNCSWISQVAFPASMYFFNVDPAK